MILTYYENIDLGSASVNIPIVSQYHIIYTDLKVHNCIMYRMFNMFLYSLMYSSFKDKQLNSNNLFSSFENKIQSLLAYSDRYVYNITGQL